MHHSEYILIYTIFIVICPAFGHEATMTQFPATIAVLRKDEFLCAGAAITNEWVITSAKCIKKIPQGELILSVGSIYWRNGYKMGVSKKVIHEQDKASDIALLESKLKFKPDKLLKVIAIHKENVANKGAVVLSGWTNQLPQLEFTKLQVEEKSCSSATSKQVCATAARGTCVGNAGSPLVFDGKLVGILPFAQKCVDNKPKLFSKLHPYVKWIKTKIKPFVDFKKGKIKSLEEEFRSIVFENVTIPIGDNADYNADDNTVGNDGLVARKPPPNKQPMVASLQMDNKHICAAVFTDPKAMLVVVSAHCCYDPQSKKEIDNNKLTVVGGTEDWSVKSKFNAKVTGKIFHPKFTRESIMFAIAILKLDKKPEKMGILQWAGLDGLPNNNAAILGWQYNVDKKTKTRTPEKKLKKSKAKFIKLPQCLRYIKEVHADTMFCGFVDITCKGDLGSPVITANGKQIGFLSYNGDCTQIEPQVFTEVAPFKRWVQKQARKLS